jgi:hypothetical protein
MRDYTSECVGPRCAHASGHAARNAITVPTIPNKADLCRCGFQSCRRMTRIPSRSATKPRPQVPPKSCRHSRHKRLTHFRPYRRRQRVGLRCLTFQSSNFPWRKTPLPTKRLGRRTPAAMSLRCRRMSRRCSLKEPWATCRISSGSRLALPVR